MSSYGSDHEVQKFTASQYMLDRHTNLATISTKFVAVSKSRGSTDLLFSIVEWFRASRRVTDNLSTFTLSASKMGSPSLKVWFRPARRLLVCNSNSNS